MTNEDKNKRLLEALNHKMDLSDSMVDRTHSRSDYLYLEQVKDRLKNYQPDECFNFVKDKCNQIAEVKKMVEEYKKKKK